MARAQIIETMAPTIRGRALRPPDAVEEDERLLFNALLYPNRSLPNAGFIAVMAVILGANLMSTLIFSIMGAWPVGVFLVVDALAVFIAFKISYRQGRQHERILMTADDLWICRVLPSGHETRWRLQPYWTQVKIDRPVEHESQLVVKSRGRQLLVGSFLSPAERGDLADALQSALDRARTGGHESSAGQHR